MHMDVRIQESVVANLSGRPAPLDVGPFLIGHDPAVTSSSINYATPRPGRQITAADVTVLVEAFRSIDRRPRLEYVTSSAPHLEELLVAAGFTVEERHTYLVCEPATLKPPALPAGFTLREPATDADLAALVSAQNEAFGGEPVADEADVVRLRRLQSRGGVLFMADTGDGVCAGGGQAVPPYAGVSEVAGIAVRVPYRRQGLAGAITANITERLFAADVNLAWLEASGEDSWRVYERLGYRPAGDRLYIGLE